MSERKILAYFILHIAGKTYSFLFSISFCLMRVILLLAWYFKHDIIYIR